MEQSSVNSARIDGYSVIAEGLYNSVSFLQITWKYKSCIGAPNWSIPLFLIKYSQRERGLREFVGAVLNPPCFAEGCNIFLHWLLISVVYSLMSFWYYEFWREVVWLVWTCTNRPLQMTRYCGISRLDLTKCFCRAVRRAWYVKLRRRIKKWRLVMLTLRLKGKLKPHHHHRCCYYTLFVL